MYYDLVLWAYLGSLGIQQISFSVKHQDQVKILYLRGLHKLGKASFRDLNGKQANQASSLLALPAILASRSFQQNIVTILFDVVQFKKPKQDKL